MSSSTENIDRANDELSPASVDEGWDFDELTIEEGDIRELNPYTGWESDKRTLVGIGRPKKPVSKRPVAAAPVSQHMPLSEPPGPFIADDDEIPPSFRSKKLGIWTVAVPALLVAAAAAVLVLRGLGPGLGRSEGHAAVAQVVPKENAALVVNLTGVDAHVFLDGQDRGLPPVLLTGLTPGSHALKISGPAYAPFEQPITLVADHVSTVEPKLTLLAAEPAAEGNAKEEPARDGSASAHAAKAATASAPAFTTAAAAPAPAVTGAPEPGVASPYMGSLSITSTPPTNVVLDGRPLGKAPRVVEVSPGAHTVVFVHPTLGRKSVSVSASAGKPVSAAVEF
jgi:hypothetical protein